MSRTLTDSRQIGLRKFLEQLASRTRHEGTGDNKPTDSTTLDFLLESIDHELTQPLRVDASVPADLTVSVGAAVMTNPETGRKRSIPHISGQLPIFPSGTITFPSTSGNDIELNPGEDVTLNIPNDEYVAVTIHLDADGQLSVEISDPDPDPLEVEVLAPPFGTLPVAYIFLYNDGGTIQPVEQEDIYQFAVGAGGGGGGGLVKVDFYDLLSPELPTGTSYTADGIEVEDGDMVLFTGLNAGNNQVYEVSGVGASLEWKAIRAFLGNFEPDLGDTVRIAKGEAFGLQMGHFNGTTFLFNDVVRHFDGINFWEQSSLKAADIPNDDTSVIFTINAAGSQNIIVDYSLSREDNKRTGALYITTNGTDITVNDTSAFIGEAGVVFNASIDGSDIVLEAVADDSGQDAFMSYSVKRWSDAPGGPTGIPSYSTGTFGITAEAAGNPGEVQFHGADGNLAATAAFRWSNTRQSVDLAGLDIRRLSTPIVLNNNQVIPSILFSYDSSLYQHAVIEYSIKRGGNVRTGRLTIANDTNNSVPVGYNDDFSEAGEVGISLDVNHTGSAIQVRYISDASGDPGEFKYSVRRWV
jgi:hypothetical protein